MMMIIIIIIIIRVGGLVYFSPENGLALQTLEMGWSKPLVRVKYI